VNLIEKTVTTAATGVTTAGTITMGTTGMATIITETSIIIMAIGMEKVKTDTGVTTGTNTVKRTTERKEGIGEE